MQKKTRKLKLRADGQASIEVILKSAEDVLDQNPMASIEDIAKAAKISRMTIYRHFKTREELLEKLTVESFIEALLTIDHFDKLAPFEEALKKLTFEFLKPSAKWRAIATHPRQSSKIKNLIHTFYQQVDSVIDAGVKSKKISKANNLTWARHVYLGLVSQAKRKEKSLNIDRQELSELIVTTFLRGLG